MAFPGLLAVCLPTVLEFSGQSGDVDWFVREAVAVPVPGSGAEFMATLNLGRGAGSSGRSSGTEPSQVARLSKSGISTARSCSINS